MALGIAVILGRLFAEVIVDEFDKGGDRLFFVGAVGDECNSRAFDDPQRQDAQKALGVYAAFVLFHPDAAFKFIGALDEERRGSGVEADLVVNGDNLRIHVIFRAPFPYEPFLFI